jgi:flagellar motility protein MotE (MotC chaperone)
MWSIRNLWAVVGVLAITPVCARAQDADWRDAAKDVVNYTAALLEVKIARKGDDDAQAGLKLAKERLLKDEKLGKVAKVLKEILKTDKPDPDKLKELRTSIKEQIKKANAGKFTEILEQFKKKPEKTTVKDTTDTDLPWPFGKG